MILSKKRITKALIRLHGCTGWSAPLLFANPRRQVFSRQGPYKEIIIEFTYLGSKKQVSTIHDFSQGVNAVRIAKKSHENTNCHLSSMKGTWKGMYFLYGVKISLTYKIHSSTNHNIFIYCFAPD